MIDYYRQILKLEPIWMQRFQNGIHTKRLKCESLQEIQQAHLKGYNHRKIGINEVVWDIDCNVEALSNDLWQKISTNLQNDGISHSVWFTSKTYHIHSFFSGFINYCKDDRKQLKLLILQNYADNYFRWCDKNMANENMNIRDFNSSHEETGKAKKIIYEFKGKSILNPIKPEILTIFNKRYKTLNQALKVKISASNEVLNPQETEALTRFLAFAQNTKFLKSGMQKNNLYFKNIAIAVSQLGLNEQQSKEIFRNVAMQCKPHTSENMKNWLKWCKQQKHKLKVNWEEVKMFYDRYSNISR